jgi:peptide/nickel transport system permease protein
MDTAIFVVRRLLLLLFTLLAVSLLIFTLTQVLPGDVATMILGMSATPDDLATLRERLGLNEPFWDQYALWLGKALHGDLGISTRFDRPVTELIGDRLANSAILGGFGLAIAVPIGIGCGILAALKPQSSFDQTASSITIFAIALPEFVTGALLIMIFSSWLGWFEPFSTLDSTVTGWARVSRFVLPALALSFVVLGYILRMVRAEMIKTLRSPFVRTAELKGLKRRTIVLRHALPLAMGPAVTVIALCLGWIAGGLVVVESMFGFPGLGRLLVFAIQNRDVPLIQAISLIVAALYAGGNLLADLAQRWLDPRTREGD